MKELPEDWVTTATKMWKQVSRCLVCHPERGQMIAGKTLARKKWGDRMEERGQSRLLVIKDG